MNCLEIGMFSFIGGAIIASIGWVIYFYRAMGEGN